MSPCFSIIIPIYNVARYLDEALASLSAQTLHEWEGLCVDDGSKDDSGEELTRWLRKESRLKAIFQPNKGVCGARNRALSIAKGDYIVFFDSDDIFAEWWLEEVFNLFKMYHVDMVRIGTVDWHDGTPTPSSVRTGDIEVLQDDNVQQWGWLAYLFSGYCCRYAYKREIAQRVRFIDGLVSKEDSVYGFSLLPYLTSVCITSSKPYLYRLRQGSATHTYISINLPLRLLDFTQHCLRHKQNNPQIESIRQDALTIFARLAFIGWLPNFNPKESHRVGELRTKLNTFIHEGCFTFKALIRPHWRPAMWLFLKWGWFTPVRVYHAIFQFYLRMRYRISGGPPNDFFLKDAYAYFSDRTLKLIATNGKF